MLKCEDCYITVRCFRRPLTSKLLNHHQAFLLEKLAVVQRTKKSPAFMKPDIPFVSQEPILAISSTIGSAYIILLTVPRYSAGFLPSHRQTKISWGVLLRNKQTNVSIVNVNFCFINIKTMSFALSEQVTCRFRYWYIKYHTVITLIIL